ncbi:hypothetical protein [Brevundimonas sp.]|uniref:hypothetical protein n=1 Tax=Brevundimonas sp. TaxID=1871086 RepID=UPI002FC812D4
MSYLNNVKRGAGATMLAQKSTSYEALDGGTIARGIPSHTVRDYFRKYGTMLNRFDYDAEYNIYYGYVRTFNRPEFLSFVALKDGYAIIVSYETHMDGIYGPDAWELRKHFADKCFLKVRLKALTFLPPPPPPPQPAQTQIAPPIPNKKSGRGWIILAVILCLILIPVAIFGVYDSYRNEQDYQRQQRERLEELRQPF